MELIPCSPREIVSAGMLQAWGKGEAALEILRRGTEFANGQLAAGLLHSKLAAMGEEFADGANGLVDRGVGVGARAGV
jgi:hypothetical protein